MSTQAGFKIEGDFITSHMRGIVLDGDWSKATNLLKDLIPGMSEEQVQGILKAETKLVGVNEVYLEDEDIEVKKEYEAALAQTYIHKRYSTENKRYKAYGYVYYASKEDVSEIEKVLYTNKSSREPRYNSQAKELGVLYMKDPNKDQCFILKNPFNEEENIAVLFESDSDYLEVPTWLKVARTPEEAINGIVFLSYIGYFPTADKLDITYRIDTEKADLITNNLARVRKTKSSKKETVVEEDGQDFQDKSLTKTLEDKINENFGLTAEEYVIETREKIFNQARERGMTFKTFTYENEITGEKISIEYPEEVILNYIVSKAHMPNLLKEWDCYSYSSFKMQNDNPYHTDAWIACGFSLDYSVYNGFHPDHKAFDRIVNEVQKNVLNFQIHILASSNKEKVSGVIRTPETFKDRKPNEETILVVQSASPEYATLASQVSAIICETGGKLAHLVIVGREMGIPIVREENATQKYRNGFQIELDLTKSTSRIFANKDLYVDEEEPINKKKNKP